MPVARRERSSLLPRVRSVLPSLITPQPARSTGSDSRRSPRPFSPCSNGAGGHRSAAVRQGQGRARPAPRSMPRDTIGIADFSQAVERAALSRRRPRQRPCREPPRLPRPRVGPGALGLSSSASRNDFGSYATSNGTYTTGDYYDGKYGPLDEGPRPRLDATTMPRPARSSSTTPGMPRTT